MCNYVGMNTYSASIARAVVAVVITATFIGAAWFGTAIASAYGCTQPNGLPCGTYEVCIASVSPDGNVWLNDCELYRTEGNN